MIRAGKKLFLFSTVFVCVLMLTIGMNGSLVCNAATQEDLSESTAPEKALTILNDVVGLDTATYRTNLDIHNQDLFFESLPQEHVKYTLESNESKLELHCNFVNEKLQSISLHALDGSSRMTQPATNTLEMAKDFLSRYQTVSKASHCEALRSMLNTVTANENVTKTSGNIKLEVIVTQNSTSFGWKYTVNGVEVMYKWVILSFENGSLAFFMDNWELYNIGSYDITISEEEAIDIAMGATENYSWTVSMGGDNPPVEVTEFTVEGVSETKLTFCNYPSKNESRNGDPLTLYPSWNIKLYFDKFYLGNVYGLDIAIWADTGEVNDIRPLFTMGYYPSNVDPNDNEDASEYSSSNTENDKLDPNLTPIAWIALPITVVLGVTIGYSKRKKAPHELHKVPKSNSLKLGGALLCLLISLTMVLMVPPTVKAEDRGLTCWGSRWTVLTNERNAALNVIGTMITYFGNRGYTCYNYYGEDTQRQNVLDNASYMEANFDYVAMFHHGHAGKLYGHWDYFDDDGPYDDDNLIWDYKVYPKTWRSKHFFVMLWSCFQGDTIYDGTDGYGVKGMPYAWHHTYPSSYGPDCFIGFKNASMPLTQFSSDNPSIDYEFFITLFYILALHQGYSVYDALDIASWYLLGCSYSSSELHTGFTADWPIWGKGKGWMKIYGNKNIHLY